MNFNKECPICSSEKITIFLRRENVSVHQNLVMRSRNEALKIPRGDLTMAVCEVCGFVFNQTFDLKKVSYGDSYDNTQTHSQMFNNYVTDLVKFLTNEKGIRNSIIVEVGCGKGQFLKALVEPSENGNTGYGFDPSYVGPLQEFGGRLRFEKRYYDASCSNILAEVVICRHVIEHVPTPLGLLKNVRKALVNSPGAKVFFETPCVGWILKNQVIWDFFYEHCSLFTETSLTTAFEFAGFNVANVSHVFGGQYLWLEASLASDYSPHIREDLVTSELAKKFNSAEEELKNRLKLKLHELVDENGIGKVAVWGAGAKGVTFTNLIDPECRLISCLVDLNPNKQGHFLPGTGHPIVNYFDLPKLGVTKAILMNPNYYKENLELLKRAKINSVELIAF